MRIEIPKATFYSALSGTRDIIQGHSHTVARAYLLGFAHTMEKIALNRAQVTRWLDDSGVYNDMSEL